MDEYATSRTAVEGGSGEASARKPWIKWLALGCGGLILLTALLGALAFVIVQKATAAPEAVVQTFLEAAGAGDYAAAHDCFSAPLAQEQSLDAFRSMVSANSHLFSIVDTSFSTRSVDLAGAEFSGTVTLEASTKMPASFKLVRENDEWRLIGYNIGE